MNEIKFTKRMMELLGSKKSFLNDVIRERIRLINDRGGHKLVSLAREESLNDEIYMLWDEIIKEG